jgi:hypothetical protein
LCRGVWVGGDGGFVGSNLSGSDWLVDDVKSDFHLDCWVGVVD